MSKYIITSSEEKDSISCADLASAKRVFCDKCNLQKPGTTLGLDKLHNGELFRVALVVFSSPGFSPNLFFQQPAVQTVKINHQLWRFG